MAEQNVAIQTIESHLHSGLGAVEVVLFYRLQDEKNELAALTKKCDVERDSIEKIKLECAHLKEKIKQTEEQIRLSKIQQISKANEISSIQSAQGELLARISNKKYEISRQQMSINDLNAKLGNLRSRRNALNNEKCKVELQCVSARKKIASITKDFNALKKDLPTVEDKYTQFHSDVLKMHDEIDVCKDYWTAKLKEKNDSKKATTAEHEDRSQNQYDYVYMLGSLHETLEKKKAARKSVDARVSWLRLIEERLILITSYKTSEKKENGDDGNKEYEQTVAKQNIAVEVKHTSQETQTDAVTAGLQETTDFMVTEAARYKEKNKTLQEKITELDLQREKLVSELRVLGLLFDEKKIDRKAELAVLNKHITMCKRATEALLAALACPSCKTVSENMYTLGPCGHTFCANCLGVNLLMAPDCIICNKKSTYQYNIGISVASKRSKELLATLDALTQWNCAYSSHITQRTTRAKKHEFSVYGSSKAI